MTATHPLKAKMPVLRKRGFRILLPQIVISNIADGFLSIAVALLAIRATDDPLLVSLATSVGALPVLILAIPIGAVVDRCNKALLMAIANAVRAAIAGCLTAMVAGGSVSILVIYIATILMSSLEPLFDNSSASLVPEVAGRDRLERANSIVQGTQFVGQTLIAVPLAAALFAIVSYGPSTVAAGAYALTAAWSTALRRRTKREPGQLQEAAADTEHHSVIDGLRHVWHDPTLSRLTISITMVSGAVTFAQSTLTLYLMRTIGVPEAYIGLFAASLAAGGLVGMQIAPILINRVGRIRSLIPSVLALGVGLLAMGLIQGVWWAAASAALISASATVWNVAAITLRQLATPDHLLGRVQGVGTSLGTGLALVAAPLGGLVAREGLRIPFIVGAFIVFSTALIVRSIPAPEHP